MPPVNAARTNSDVGDVGRSPGVLVGRRVDLCQTLGLLQPGVELLVDGDAEDALHDRAEVDGRGDRQCGHVSLTVDELLQQCRLDVGDASVRNGCGVDARAQEGRNLNVRRRRSLGDVGHATGGGHVDARQRSRRQDRVHASARTTLVTLVNHHVRTSGVVADSRSQRARIGTTVHAIGSGDDAVTHGAGVVEEHVEGTRRADLLDVGAERKAKGRSTRHVDFLGHGGRGGRAQRLGRTDGAECSGESNELEFHDSIFLKGLIAAGRVPSDKASARPGVR
jgi:hypothetical protein